MGREIRRVPADWQHPRNEKGHHIPLFDGFNERLMRWEEEAAKWSVGLVRDFADRGWKPRPKDIVSFEEWSGLRPDPTHYIPDFAPEERTHWQMYETCTEGTPISPAMETPEALARWLTDTGASAFGEMTASYEEWLAMIAAGFCVGMAVTLPDSVIMPGVALAKSDDGAE